jgi:hypothetical protein
LRRYRRLNCASGDFRSEPGRTFKQINRKCSRRHGVTFYWRLQLDWTFADTDSVHLRLEWSLL